MTEVSHIPTEDSSSSLSMRDPAIGMPPSIPRQESTKELGSSKEKVRFEEDCNSEEEVQGHRRTPSGEKLSKFKPFKKNDAPISKELSERARSAPLVKKFALPATETLINDYSAALLKHILIHGRMYLSQNYICFESKIFGIKTMEVIPFKDVTYMAKRSKKLKFAHGIEVTTSSQTYYFASFVSREKALETLTKIWREHVPKTDSHNDDDDDEEDDTDEGNGTATQDYESDDSTLKKKDKKTIKEHTGSKLGRSIEVTPDYSEEREKRRFSSPLLSRVLPSGASKHSNSMSSLSSSTSNLEPMDSAAGPKASPPKANPALPSASAPTSPAHSPQESESEDEEEGTYDEGDGFLASEAQLQQVLVTSFPVNVKTFFKIFFSDDSSFSKLYHEARGDKELIVKKWSNSPQFGLIRDVLFSSPVKVPLGPSHTRITETQRYHLTKSRLLIDTISMMLDIPYGDSFRVEGKWDVTATTPDSCKLVVNIGVHFMKKTWFKGKIETQTLKETKESFQQWASLAPTEITKYKASLPSSQSPSSTSSPAPTQDGSRATATTSARSTSSAPGSSSSSSIIKSTKATTSSSNSIITQTTSESTVSQTSVSFTPTIMEDRSKSIEGGKLAMVTRIFTTISNPVPGFSLAYIVMVLLLAMLFMHMYLRITHLEGRIETLESILQPLLTKALSDKL